MAVVVRSPDNLEWKVTREVVPNWMRPPRLTDPADRYALAGFPAGRGGGIALPALLLGAAISIVCLPLVPLVFLLRRLGLVSTVLRAVTRPWGHRGPPMVLVYSIRGRPDAVERAQAELVAKLERGDGAPELVGAERIA